MQDVGLTTGAVCVYPARVPDAVAALNRRGVSSISVAAVAMDYFHSTTFRALPGIELRTVAPVRSLLTSRVRSSACAAGHVDPELLPLWQHSKKKFGTKASAQKLKMMKK